MSHALFQETYQQLELMYGRDKCQNVYYVSVTQQATDLVCGIMAIAFALSCLYGEDPGKIQYDLDTIRYHLYQCIINGYLAAFPQAEFTLNDAR